MVVGTFPSPGHGVMSRGNMGYGLMIGSEARLAAAHIFISRELRFGTFGHRCLRGHKAFPEQNAQQFAVLCLFALKAC